jgi:hypothetical protein
MDDARGPVGHWRDTCGFSAASAAYWAGGLLLIVYIAHLRCPLGHAHGQSGLVILTLFLAEVLVDAIGCELWRARVRRP